MEQSGRRWAAAGLAATFWVGAATGLIADGTPVRDTLAAALCLAGVGALLWGWWPQVRSRLRSARPGGDQRRKNVAGELRDYAKELDNLYRQSQNDPSEDAWLRANRARERADAVLVPWKRRVLERLDSDIGREAAMQIYGLGSGLRSGAPGAHVRDSYERHREFLERLAAEVELGEVRVQQRSQRSGEVLPVVESFLTQPRAEGRALEAERAPEAPPSRAEAPERRTGERFTTAGLSWRVRLQSAKVDGWDVVLYVDPDGPLPQPLVVRVRCSSPITEVHPHLSTGASPGQYTSLGLTHQISGPEARIVLKYPKLTPPARLLVGLYGPAASPPEILSVDRLVVD